ncbi:MAG: MAPEG family protein [Alphaproteobacteria bacterium]|nr:MAPEG family protein [Alphaproteobacteria bacterium]MBV9693148.1 MAPEG family protein [Alphaproteobacteria bacterium]
MLFCAIALGLVQLLLAVLASLGARGMPWALGPRDDPGAGLGNIGGRLDRAFRNFLETFGFFAAAVLLAHALDRSNAHSALGAQIYVWARLLYVPAYVIAIPFLRTLIWAASLAGIVMVLSAIWPG